MKKERSGAIVRRLGPIGLSLVAAAITAAGFAAISMAAKDDNGNSSGNGSREAGVHIAIGPHGPLGENLSEEDRQKLEDFRECLNDQGVEPPERPRFDPGNPPEPPSREEIEELRRAHEACKGKLPEHLQDIPGPIVGHGCGPGGPPPARKESEEQGENQSQGFVVPAPAPSGTS